MRVKLAALVFTVAAATSACSGDSDRRLSNGPNLVLISIDTLRADRLSLYGHHRPTTPFLEQFASSAVVFDTFHYSGGGTLPSHMSMLTGLHPVTHQITPHTGRMLEPERVTLAEALRSLGFRTAAFVDGGWMGGQFGFTQGFDVYDDKGGKLAAILPKARRWLDRHHGDRFFLFLHTYDVHSEKNLLPYECPDDLHLRFTPPGRLEFDGCRGGRCASELLIWINEEVRAGRKSVEGVLSKTEIELMQDLYDGCIAYVDREIETLVRHLADLEVLENTVVVITSDHGEEFADHGMVLHEQTGYQELARLPLVIRFPDAAHAGLRVPHLAAMVDLMPTLLEILDIPIPDQVQGRSVLGSVTGGQSVRDDLHMYSSIRSGYWNFHSDRRELYNLQDDPLEQINLYDRRPAVTEELERRVRSLLREDHRRFEAFKNLTETTAGRVILDEAQIRELRSLGYVVE